LLTTDAVPTSTLTGAAVMLLTDGVFPASTVLTTDRIVVKVRVTNTDSTTNSITFHTEGNTNYSVATTTLNQVIPTGAVTSVTGTAPIASSGGTTPAISISQSGAASDGYLSSTDWNTFNNKVDDNIYTADGTVTGTRTVDLDGNTINFNDGKLGVNITPTAPLHVQTIAVPSSNESIARFTVSDAAGAALTILNASSTDGRFVPEISGLQGLNTDNAFKQTSYIQPTQDSGSTPVTVFSAALSTLTAIVTRPLYQFRNAGTSLLTMLANGNLGIGTTTPSTPLHVRSTAIPSAGEPIARFDVSDASGYVQIANSTALDGTFGPLIQGRQIGSSTQQAIGLEGVIDVADDTGTVPVTIFQSRLATLVQVVTRPVYQFRNWTLNIMTMLPNGNVGIGTTTPTEKLEVAGKTKTTTFQLTTTPTAGYVLTSDASGNGTWSAAAGGLTYFTEAQNTSGPNATVPVDSLTALSATTNADVAIVPKGTGAFILQVPDNTITSGNKRGSNAIDLQKSRAFATQVASGNNSAIIGGFDNRASGDSSLAGGVGNTASGSLSVAIGQNNSSSNTNSSSFGNENLSNGLNSVAIGRFNNASGTSSVAIGGNISNYNTASGTRSVSIGEANTASGTNATTIGKSNIANAVQATAIGNACTASGEYSHAMGNLASTLGIYGRYSYASGQEAVIGDSQASKFVLRNRTTDATATTITSDSGAASTTNQVILSNQSAYRFKGTIVGKQSGSVNAAVWDVDGFIVRGANAAATTLNVSNVNLVQNTPAWGTPTLAADTTNGGLRVQVTGASATNIQWTCTIDTTEVIYA
jgi:hypothetical protein